MTEPKLVLVVWNFCQANARCHNVYFGLFAIDFICLPLLTCEYVLDNVCRNQMLKMQNGNKAAEHPFFPWQPGLDSNNWFYLIPHNSSAARKISVLHNPLFSSD
jgi:hypothetical protein